MPKINLRFRRPGFYLPTRVIKFACAVAALLIVASVGLLSWRWYAKLTEPVFTLPGREVGRIATLMQPVWREILFGGVPMLREMTSPQVPITVKKINPSRGFLSTVTLFLVNVDMKDPRTFLTAQIPLLNRWPLPLANTAAAIPHLPKFEALENISPGEPLVAIYHTHTSEAYASYGKTHAPGGQKGDIVEVGAALAAALQQAGIPALHNQTVHDYPSFMKAYAPSEVSAKKMLAEHQSIQMLFDIHRDADKRENTTAVIGGEEVARIRIVVAIGQPDLPQPYWQQNHAFAKLIEAKMNEMYPGLSRGILLADWRYNQHLHPRALLLEVGAQENSCEEAQRSMGLLAKILTEIMRENR
ncbi:MAG: stage II sporulation protein P [Bacillota bacterium]